MLACICDLETCGPEPTDPIVEIASYLMPECGLPASPFSCLVAPPCPIPPSASAIHHLIDEDVANAAPWSHISTVWFAKVCEADVMVAHNARFEMGHLAELMAPRPWVCTYKCAMRAWPDAPAFGNQDLRYWRNPAGLDRRLASESHRALPDAYVTAFLFRELLVQHDMETLIQWSSEIPMPPKVSFGKHKGMEWHKLPFDYLEWIVRKSDMDDDTKAYAEDWMGRRNLPRPNHRTAEADARATLYVTLATPVIEGCNSIDDLNAWWRDEAEARAEYGIVKGTPEFSRIVELCASRKAALAELISAF